MTQSLEKHAEVAAADHAATAVQREADAPEAVAERTPLPLRRVQRQSGNRAAASMVRRSSSLVVGAADDRHEREADSVADSVVAALKGGVDGSGRGTVIDVGTSAVRRPQRKESAEAGVTTEVGLEGGAVGVDFEQGLARAKGSGAQIETPLRRRMEGALGADLSDVRLHSGSESTELNDKVQAKAFTVGSDIFFRDGLPDTSSTDGQQLLAHEVTHTLQQSGGAQRQVQRFWNPFKKKAKVSDRNVAKKVQNATGKDKAQDAEEGDEFDTAEAVNESVVSPMGATSIVTGQDSYSDDMSKATDKKTNIGKSGADEGASLKLDIAGGSAEFVGMFFSIAAAVKEFREADSDGDKLMAGMEGAHAVLGGAAGMAKVVDKGSKLTGKYGRDTKEVTGADGKVSTEDNGAKGVGASSDAANALGGIADSFGAIKEGFYVVKGIAELVTKANEMTNEEKFKASMEVISHSLEAAKGAVSAAKSFLDMAGSSVTTEMIGAIPGLGIAISCADLIVRAYDLIVSNIQASAMRDRKRELKVALGGKEGESFEKRANELLVSGTEEQKAQASEYLASKGLEYINRKRSNRAILKLTVAMTKIAGDAATLGGASAPVGIGLKVGALALDVGASVFRRFKQWARDSVAKSEDEANAAAAAKGETREKGFLAYIFDTDKSSTKKQAEYNRQVDRVFAMISAVDTSTKLNDPKVDAAKRAQVKSGVQEQMVKVSTYLDAMGYSLAKMNKDVTKDPSGKTVRKHMIEAMKKRE